LDMPLQHVSDRLLKLMNRRHTRRESETIIDRLRASIPGLVLRTTFIVGFPGETEDDFAELEGFVRQTRFERLGVFVYSPEPDTPAVQLSGHVEPELKEARRRRLLEVQQPIAFEFNQGLVGRSMEVIVDGPAVGEPGLWVGRTYADAPDVDGVVLVRGAGLASGMLAECEITAARGYDLQARVVAGRKPTRARPRPRRMPRSGLVVLDEP